MVSDVDLSYYYDNIGPKLEQQPPVIAMEGDTVEILLNASDLNGDSLTFSIENLPEGAFSRMVGLPGYWALNTKGSIRLIFLFRMAMPKQNMSMQLIVKGVNRPPYFGTLENFTIKEDSLLVFKLPAFDEDNDVLETTVEPLPQGARFENGNFVWKPAIGQVGEYGIQFLVSDGQYSIQDLLTLIVHPKNRAPTFLAYEEIIGKENENLLWVVQVQDLDGDSIQITPSGLHDSIRFSTTQSTTPIPDSGSAGDFVAGDPHLVSRVYRCREYPFQLQVSDGTHEKAESFIVKILNTNRKPRFQPKENMRESEGSRIQFAVKADDEDGDAIVYRLLGKPSGRILREINLTGLPGQVNLVTLRCNLLHLMES